MAGKGSLAAWGNLTMRLQFRWLPVLALGVSMCGCTAPLTGLGALTHSGTAPQQAGEIVSNNSGNLVPAIGSGLISNNSGSLSGVVRGSAGIVSNNSGNYRITSNDDVPLSGIRVRLLNAAGQPLMDVSGHAIDTITDAQGAYRFGGVVPARNLLVAVDLPADKGRLLAIAPKDGPTQRVADLSLVSSLTTGYIVDQYVNGQPDPQTTLDKLPPSVETDLRAKARTALTSQAASITSLSTEEVVRTVNTLREHDHAFDTLLEDVRRLLIAAGQSDLGDGLPGTRVMLFDLRDLACRSDGTLLVCSNEDGRVYRLAADGRLIKVAGTGSTETGSLDGKAALDAGFGRIAAMTLDEQGDLLILENDYLTSRLSRVDAGGRVHAVDLGGRVMSSVAAGPGQLIYGFDHQQVWSISPTGAVQSVFTVPDLPLQDLSLKGRDGDGNLYFHALMDGETGRQEVYRLNLQTGSFQRMELAGRGDVNGTLCIDGRGNVFLGGEGGTDNFLAVYSPGQPQRLIPNDIDGYPIKAAAATVDGRTYVALSNLDNPVYRIADGKATHVAGYTSVGVTGDVLGDANSLALGMVSGMAVSGSGDLYVAQSNGNYSEPSRILRVTLGRQASVHAASTTWDMGVLAFGPDQALYFRDNGKTEVQDGDLAIVYRIHKLAADGTDQVVVQPDAGFTGNWDIDDFTIGADGTIMACVNGQIRRYSSDGTLLSTVWTGGQPMPLALDAQGVLWFVSGETLRKWTSGAGVQTVFNDARLASGTSLVLDGAGRAYLSRREANEVLGVTLATGQIETIAGPGGRHFAGRGVDDSLKSPGFLAIDPEGTLLISDYGHRQIKRIAASGLR